jgi:alkylhydroperoxidase family enzyme
MLRALVLTRIATEERRLGMPLDYVKYIVRTSLAAFFRYTLFLPMSRYRHRLPADAFYVARLIATAREDCGSCVQIVVNLARKSGVRAEVLEAVLANRIEPLTDDLQDVFRFTHSVLDANYDEADLRQRLQSRYGEEAMIELAFAIATARVFPVTKRALGYAVSCSSMRIQM